MLGVVYVPVTGVLYYGAEGIGSFSVLVNNELPLGDVEAALASAVALPANGQPAVYTIVASRSHNTPETDVLLKKKKRTRNG